MKINWSRISEIVIEIEGKFAGLSGKEKKEYAIELIDVVINLPFPFSLFERAIYGFAVDAVVAGYNKVGHDWWKKLFDNKKTAPATPQPAGIRGLGDE